MADDLKHNRIKFRRHAKTNLQWGDLAFARTLTRTPTRTHTKTYLHPLTYTYMHPHTLPRLHPLTHSSTHAHTFLLKDMISHKKLFSPSHKVSPTQSHSRTHTQTHTHSTPTPSHGLLTFKQWHSLSLSLSFCAHNHTHAHTLTHYLDDKHMNMVIHTNTISLSLFLYPDSPPSHTNTSSNGGGRVGEGISLCVPFLFLAPFLQKYKWFSFSGTFAKPGHRRSRPIFYRTLPRDLLSTSRHRRRRRRWHRHRASQTSPTSSPKKTNKRSKPFERKIRTFIRNFVVRNFGHRYFLRSAELVIISVFWKMFGGSEIDFKKSVRFTKSLSLCVDKQERVRALSRNLNRF